MSYCFEIYWFEITDEDFAATAKILAMTIKIRFSFFALISMVQEFPTQYLKYSLKSPFIVSSGQLAQHLLVKHSLSVE